MSTPVIVWTAIIGLFVATVVIRLAIGMIHNYHHHHAHGIITTGTEREEFYVPGDRTDKDEDLFYDED